MRISPHFAVAAFLSVATVAVTLTGAPRRAAACAPPPCEPAHLAPPSGATIPASALALPYRASTGGGGDPTSAAFHLFDPSQQELPTTSNPDPWWRSASLLVPATPLATGNGFSIRYTEPCTFGGASPKGEHVFAVGASSALPATTGELHAANWRVTTRSIGTSSGSCFTNTEVVDVDVVVKATPELLAFAPLAGFEVLVDGQPALSVFYGESKRTGDTLHLGTLHAVCGARNPTDDNGVTLGVHDVEVRSHVAGAAHHPADAKARFQFSCTDSNVEVVTSFTDPNDTRTPDAGTPRGDDSVAAHGPSGADDPTVTAGCGCTTAGRRSRASDGFVLGAAFALALAAGVRRRLTARARCTRS